jgi:hypothetical protein
MAHINNNITCTLIVHTYMPANLVSCATFYNYVLKFRHAAHLMGKFNKKFQTISNKKIGWLLVSAEQ